MVENGTTLAARPHQLELGEVMAARLEVRATADVFLIVAQ